MMGGLSGNIGPAIGGSPFGGMRVLSPMDIARASPQYDPYTAARRPNYMPFGPNQQFYQPIYRPSYGQFSPLSQFQQPTYNAPLQSPQPMQSQFRPIPFMNQTQIDARQAAANPPAPSYADSGFKQGGAVDDGIASLLKK